MGVALSGALIYQGLDAGQDSFVPRTGTAINSTLNACLGKIDTENRSYRYYSFSYCMFKSFSYYEDVPAELCASS